MEHNKIPYEKVLDSLNDNLNTIYISGTGTGKSFICMSVIEKLQLKTLYVYPKHIIGKGIRKYKEFKDIEHLVSFTTFNSFTTPEKSYEILGEYDLIVIDECHHLLSDVYGNNLYNAYKNSDNLKVLGLTATPVIGGVSCVSLFDNSVEGLSVMDAIEVGLMPTIDYNIACQGITKDLLKSHLFTDIDVEIDIDKSYDILKKLICVKQIDKWVCFFNDSKQLLDMYDTITRLFDGYKVIPVLSKLDNLDSSMLEASLNKKVVILTCMMFTEGVHLSGIRGILILRNITSPSLFMQVIGRVCKIGTHNPPTVIDCSRSAYSLLYMFAKRSFKHSNSCLEKNKNPIVKITINGIREVSNEELCNIFEKISSPIVFRGVKYSSYVDICDDYNISIADILKCQKDFKISKIQAISTLISKIRN